MITNDQGLTQFKMDMRYKLAELTLKGISIECNKFFSEVEKVFQEVTTKDVREWLVQLESSGYTKGTIRTKLLSLKTFFRYCLEEELIDKNPLASLPVPVVDDSEPYYLSNDELEQLREATKGELLDRAIIEVLYTTGIRLGELTFMEKEDINWSERMIHIHRGKSKKDRIVLFTRQCEGHLREYLHSRSDNNSFIFVNRMKGNQMVNQTVQQMFKKYRKQLGFHVTPHTLRHTFAAHLAIRGMPLVYIQTLLGHETQKHTHVYARLYTHARKEIYDQWM